MPNQQTTPVYDTLLTSVGEEISRSNGKVRAEVIEILAEKEINSRVVALQYGIDQLRILKKELKHLDKPDTNIRRSRNGTVTDKGDYSEKRVKEIQKTESMMKKYDMAISAALPSEDSDTKADYGPLKNLMSAK